MPNTALNRTTVLVLTNNSGGDVAQGDVVIIDAAATAAFTTTTTGALADASIGVVIEPNGIVAGAMGLVAFAGYVPKINLSGAASLGDFFKTHTVAKQAVRHASPAVVGDFGEVLGTGTSPAALLWGFVDKGAGAAHDPVTLDADAAAILDLNTQEIGLDVQAANTVFAGPTTGADNEPTFRALVAADLGTGTPDGTLFLRDDLSWQATGGSGQVVTINYIIDGGGAAITTGVKGDIVIDFACTINAWTLLADASGAIKIDLWKDTYANYPPTDADSITNAHEPEIAASGNKAQDTDLSDWADVTVDAGDTIRVNVDSAATIARVTLALKVTRS